MLVVVRVVGCTVSEQYLVDTSTASYAEGIYQQHFGEFTSWYCDGCDDYVIMESEELDKKEVRAAYKEFPLAKTLKDGQLLDCNTGKIL